MPETTIAPKQSALLTTCSPRLLFEAKGKKRRGGDEDEGLSNDAAEVAGANKNGNNTKADHVVVGTRKYGNLERKGEASTILEECVHLEPDSVPIMEIDILYRPLGCRERVRLSFGPEQVRVQDHRDARSEKSASRDV